MDFWLICSSLFENKVVKKRSRKENKKEDEKIKNLQIIVHKLNEIPDFANKYDIKYEQIICTHLVRIMRKEKPIQEKYVYSPSIDIEYRTDRSVCFDIQYDDDKRLMVTPKTTISKYNDYGRPFGKTEYVKNINFDQIDYNDIVKYITETSLNLRRLTVLKTFTNTSFWKPLKKVSLHCSFTALERLREIFNGY